MAGELIPPPGLDAGLPDSLTPQQGVRLWIELMETCHELLLAGIRASCTDPMDERSAHRQWYRETMREHDRMIRRLAENFQQRYQPHAPPCGHSDT